MNPLVLTPTKKHTYPVTQKTKQFADTKTWISFADLHLRSREPLGGKNSSTGIDIRTEDKLKSLSSVIQKAVEEKVIGVFSIGDLFDTPTPPEWLIDLFLKTIQPLVENRIKFVYILGNHGTTFKSYGMKPFKTLLSMIRNESLIVVDVPVHLLLEGIDFFCVPEWPGVLDVVQNEKADVLCAHLAIQGAATSYASLDGIPSSALKGFKTAHLGHVHLYQSRDNWTYCGSLSRKDFSEAIQTTGFLLGASLPDGSYKTTYQKISDREFVNVLASEEGVEYSPSQPSWRGSIVKIKVEGSRAWLASQKVRDLLEEVSGHEPLKVYRELISTDRRARREEQTEETKSLEEAMNVYLERDGQCHADKSALLSFGKLLTTMEAQ